MNNLDLIDRKLAEEEIQNCRRTVSQCLTCDECRAFNDGVSEALESIKSIPTIKVPHAKHGHWIDYQMGKWIYAQCSVCKCVRDDRTPFCPICGAVMDEVINDEDTGE